jgi:hypothetical protein
MKHHRSFSILLPIALVSACDQPVAPSAEPALQAFASAQASPHMTASGAFTQTAITSLVADVAGPNTILHQTATGLLSGTLSGAFEDDLKVMIHPNGNFAAQFTIRCVCTVDGKTGVLEITAEDNGELVSPALATFAGRAVITGGSGDLSGLRGILEIEGTVDVQSGLATYAYSGTIHFRP